MKLTIFTPTYNRAYIIENLYHSLQRQTVTNFEWLVVDDGSQDNTAELFAKWQNERNPFTIHYYYTENGGKCRAINYALDLAKGELFFTIDSDDYLTNDAVEKILEWERTLPTGEKYCGIAGNLGINKKQTPNTIFSSPYLDATLLERYRMIDGERAMVFYTDIHRKYKYPVFDNEKFMTEAIAWNRMAADGHKMRFYNDIIWIYKYLDDGLTRAGKRLFHDNPRGYGLWLRERAEFERWSPVQKIKLIYSFSCELYKSYDIRTIAECIGTDPAMVRLCIQLHKLKTHEAN